MVFGQPWATSSKRAYAISSSVAPRACVPAQATVDPHLHRRHSNTVLSQSLWGPWVLVCTRFFCVCALQESVSQFYVSSGCSVVGLMPTFSKRAYAIPRSTATRAPALQQSTADPYLHRRHSNTVLSQSLWGVWVLVHTRFCLCLARVCFPVPCKFW